MVIKLVNGILIMKEKICKQFVLNQNIRGGGLYDEDSGVKIGKWIDIGEGFEKES